MTAELDYPLSVGDVWRRKRDGRTGRVAHIFPGGGKLQYWVVGGPLNGRLRNHGARTFLRQWDRAIVHPGRGWGEDATADPIARARAEGHAAGRIEGRRDGIEEAARVCEGLAEKAASQSAAYQHRWEKYGLDECARDLRALLIAPAPKEGGSDG